MTDVRDAPASANENQAGSNGDFIWYELMTPDPEGAKEFYDAVVGWTISEGAPEFNGYRMIGRSDGGFGGGVLKLTDDMRNHGAMPIWMGYLGADDVDATVAQIEARGGKTLMPAFDIPQGRIAMAADPQGNPFYVMKPVPPADNPEGESDLFSPTEEQRVSWNELATADPTAARRFYGELFGWTSEEFMPMGELGEYRFFDHAGTRIGAVYKPQDEGFAGKKSTGWRYYIRVPSIAAAKQAAEAEGATIHMGPHQVPTGDYIIVGSDPQGAEFALVGGA